jgi:hypothetical protein
VPNSVGVYLSHLRGAVSGPPQILVANKSGRARLRVIGIGEAGVGEDGLWLGNSVRLFYLKRVHV